MLKNIFNSKKDKWRKVSDSTYISTKFLARGWSIIKGKKHKYVIVPSLEVKKTTNNKYTFIYIGKQKMNKNKWRILKKEKIGYSRN